MEVDGNGMGNDVEIYDVSPTLVSLVYGSKWWIPKDGRWMKIAQKTRGWGLAPPKIGFDIVVYHARSIRKTGCTWNQKTLLVLRISSWHVQLILQHLVTGLDGYDALARVNKPKVSPDIVLRYRHERIVHRTSQMSIRQDWWMSRVIRSSPELWRGLPNLQYG